MKYKNYLNTKNGSNRIYSTDNLLQMTMNDILDAEDALGYQYNTIGLPDDSDLFNSSFVRQTRTPKGTLEWQSILDDGIAPQTNIVNHIVDPQTSNLKTPPFVPQYKQVMNTTPQNIFSTQKSTYELLEEERERQRQQQLQQQQLAQNLGNTPVQTTTSSIPMEEIAPVDLGGTSVDMNLVGDLVNTAVNKYKTWKKKPESKSVLKDAIDSEVTNKPPKQTDLQEAIKTSTTPDVEESKNSSPIGNAIEEATTLRNDPLWDELTKSLPNATPEMELTPEEQFQLEQFNKAWDKKNGVKPVDGVPTGGAAGVNNSQIDPKYIKNNELSHSGLTMSWDKRGNIVYSLPNGRNANPSLGEKIQYGIEDAKEIAQVKASEFFNRDFDKNSPMTSEEKVIDNIFENVLHPFYPMSSNATRNGMHDMQASHQETGVKVYETVDSLDDSISKNFLKSIGVPSNSKGSVYAPESSVSKQFSYSPELEAYFTKIRKDVLNGKPLANTILNYSASSRDAYENPGKFDRHTYARNISLVNPKVDNNGVFTCKLIDYSDFKDEPVNSLSTYANRWGYKMQEKGLYKPHYQVIEIRRKVNW